MDPEEPGARRGTRCQTWVVISTASLGLLFIAVATVFDSMWALFGGALTRLLPKLRVRVIERLSAGAMAALAVLPRTVRLIHFVQSRSSDASRRRVASGVRDSRKVLSARLTRREERRPASG